MVYPTQIDRTYVNPDGNLAASGYYRSSVTQELANMMPPWMRLRQDPQSVGQQFLSVPSVQLNRLETDLNDAMRSKFITTARLDDVDVLYRAKLLSDIDLTDVSASGVRCIAAPSGCSASGVSQIYIKEIDNLEEFYYNVLPTRVELLSSGVYVASIDGVSWNTKPSGIYDTEEKHVDVWGTTHDISWCYANGNIMKQDVETMEDYESYTSTVTGAITDMAFYKGILWGLSTSGATSYLTLMSTKTQEPNNTALDTLAEFELTDAFTAQPSGILIGDDGRMWVCDTNKVDVFEVAPRYDYFILDEDNRYVYLREDYRDSGVFMSNT
jgi:hypothetical protein